jgi:hypothetical protein
MKRCFVSMILIGLVALFGPTSLHAQKIYTNSKPMTFGHNMRVYYGVQKNNLTVSADAVPEDKFFATPPGYTKDVGTAEQSSIGAEVGHAVDAQYRMCMLITTGQNPPSLPGTEVLKMANPTKAAMMAALAKSFACVDLLINNFDDAKITAMVNSQHSLQPLGSTVFNIISHDREVYGRIMSFMVSFGIKGPREINASDPENPDDLYFCGGTSSKTMENCK